MRRSMRSVVIAPSGGTGFDVTLPRSDPSTRRQSMRNVRIFALVLALGLACSERALAQAPGASLVGVWKLTSFVRKEVGNDKVANSFGEHPAGYRVHTAGGHAFYFFVDRDRKAPEGAVTDADRVQLYKTMTAAAGTYVVEAD